MDSHSDTHSLCGVESVEEFLKKHERALKGTEERLLIKSDNQQSDDEGWRSEALAVIADIEPFVAQISIATELPCDENGVYMNLQTKEGAMLTVELSAAGFRPCARQFNSVSEPESLLEAHNEASALVELDVHYETPYALLGSISPAYRDSFCNELALRLQALCK